MCIVNLAWWKSKCVGNYLPQTKFAKVMFLHVSVCPQGGLRPTPGERLRGLAGGGVSRSTPRRGPGPSLGVYTSMHWGRPLPQQTATAAGSTHPTGMHSCYTCHPLAPRSSFSIDGSKGREALGVCTPLVQFLSFKCSFRDNNGQIIGWYPWDWGWRSPPGKSWICHCLVWLTEIK